MFSLIKNHPKAVLWAFIVHIVFLVTMGISFHFIDAPSVSSPEVKVVKATLKDDSIAQKQLKKKLAAADREKKRLEKKQEQEKQRQEKIKQEKQRVAELKKSKLAQVKAQKKLAQQKREKEKAAKKRIEEEHQKQVDAENKRIEEQKERQRREDKLKKALEEEQQRLSAERKVRNETIISKQVRIIQDHIEQRWIKPASTRAGMTCTIRVSLIPSGEVINVRYIKRSGDSAFDQSVYTAVKRASPLPLPPVEYGLSDRFREIDLNFGQQK